MVFVVAAAAITLSGASAAAALVVGAVGAVELTSRSVNGRPLRGAEPAAEDELDGAPEMNVEQGVEEPVEGEVEGLEDVGSFDGGQQGGVADLRDEFVVSERR